MRDSATCPNCGEVVTVTCNRPYRFAIDPPSDSPVEGAWVMKAVIDPAGEIIDEFKVSAAGQTVDFIAARSGFPLGASPSYEVHRCPDRPSVDGGDSTSVPAKPSSSPPTREGSAAVEMPSPQTSSLPIGTRRDDAGSGIMRAWRGLFGHGEPVG